MTNPLCPTCGTRSWQASYDPTLTLCKCKFAKGKCRHCKEVLESERPGDFVSCTCGAAAVDTDRWFPTRHRFIGDVEPVVNSLPSQE